MNTAIDIETTQQPIDEQEDDEESQQSTFGYAMINFIKSLFGIAIIDMPYAANEVGLLWSSILLLIVAALTCRSTNMLIQVVNDITLEPISYGQACKMVLGTKAAQLSNLFILLNQMCLCIAYVIFFTRFFAISFTLLNIYLNNLVYIILPFLCVLPIIFANNIHLFRRLSLLGLLLIAFALLSIQFYELQQITLHNTHPITYFAFSPTFTYVAIAITSMEGAMTILPCRSSMIDNQQTTRLLYSSIALYVLAVLLMQLTAIVVFGNTLDQMILFNLPPTLFYYFVLIAYALQVMTTYPVQIFPAHIILDQAIAIYNYKPITRTQTIKSLLLRLLLTILIFLIAYVIPNFSSFLGLIGALFGSTMQYIIPVLMHWRRFVNQSHSQIAEYVSILVIASFATLFGCYQTITSMII